MFETLRSVSGTCSPLSGVEDGPGTTRGSTTQPPDSLPQVESSSLVPTYEVSVQDWPYFSPTWTLVVFEFHRKKTTKIKINTKFFDVRMDGVDPRVDTEKVDPFMKTKTVRTISVGE